MNKSSRLSRGGSRSSRLLSVGQERLHKQTDLRLEDEADDADEYEDPQDNQGDISCWGEHGKVVGKVTMFFRIFPAILRRSLMFPCILM